MLLPYLSLLALQIWMQLWTTGCHEDCEGYGLGEKWTILEGKCRNGLVNGYVSIR